MSRIHLSTSLSMSNGVFVTMIAVFRSMRHSHSSHLESTNAGKCCCQHAFRCKEKSSKRMLTSCPPSWLKLSRGHNRRRNMVGQFWIPLFGCYASTYMPLAIVSLDQINFGISLGVRCGQHQSCSTHLVSGIPSIHAIFTIQLLSFL